jgi:hypothetical protein
MFNYVVYMLLSRCCVCLNRCIHVFKFVVSFMHILGMMHTCILLGSRGRYFTFDIRAECILLCLGRCLGLLHELTPKK